MGKETFQNRSAEIEARWKAATPGPWALEGDTTLLQKETGNHIWSDSIGHYPSMEAIAKAPEDVAYLLKLVRHQQKTMFNYSCFLGALEEGMDPDYV